MVVSGGLAVVLAVCGGGGGGAPARPLHLQCPHPEHAKEKEKCGGPLETDLRLWASFTLVPLPGVPYNPPPPPHTHNLPSFT